MRRFVPLHLAFTFLVMTLLLGACASATGPGGTPPPGGPPPGGPPPGGPPPGGPLPPSGPYEALQGIWQETRASLGDFRNPTTGYEFSATEGFSTQLVIGATGSYRQTYYASGYSSACSLHITYLEQSVGTVAVSGNQLKLQPTEHKVVVTGCGAGTVDLGRAPVEYTFTVRQEFFDASGRNYYLDLEGGPHLLELQGLYNAPASPPVTQPQPADFELGTVPVYLEFLGTWSPAVGSRLDFYDPDTNEYYIPDLDGNPHKWIRFYDEPDRNYEFANVWRGTLSQGVCKNNEIYWERGKTVFQILENDSSGVFGHVRFEPTDARLIVVVSNCEELDHVVGYELPLVTSYYRFRYQGAGGALSDYLGFNCYWDRTEWQYMMCGDTNWGSFYLR